MSDDKELIPQPEDMSSDDPAASDQDDVRFAPPAAAEDEAEAVEEDFALTEIPLDESLDIDAALAAVSALDDMLAEREAAEQAVIAKAEAEAQAAAERKAPLEHPEMFFPIPPQMKFQRGQMASVVPALLLMVVGAWLTFTLTTTAAPPDAGLTAAVVGVAAVVVMGALWLTTGGWARGGLFFAIMLLAGGGVLFFLSQPGSPGAGGWPLLLTAPGLGFILSGLLARPAERRFIFPGLALVISAGAGLLVTGGMMDAPLLTTIGGLWPLALLAVVIILLLPIIFRQRG